jgi:NAD(P)-dependent dehydrogenase (short-subunit alcohol dehydrogenase family)
MGDHRDVKRTALVIGASRGLGLALTEELWSRGWSVIATKRDDAPALRALAGRSGGQIELKQIDIADPEGARDLKVSLSGRQLNLLFVNAGISLAKEDTASSANESDFIAMMMTNAFSPMRVMEALEPLVILHGVIAFMSSELASLGTNPGVCDLYAASKAALNMLVKCYAARRPEDNRAVLLIAPGWVRTGTGGDEALLSIDESIPLVASLLEANLGRPGLRFVDRFDQPIPW